MAKEDGVRFIERLFPGLRPRYVHHEDDEDICQVVLCDMLRKWDSLAITTDSQFANTFSRFYGTRKWINRGRRARQMASGTYWMTHPGGIPTRYLGHEGKHGKRVLDGDLAISSTASLTTQYNPWCSHRTEALEWIAQLPTPLYRRVLTLYFIEGYTLSETGALLGWHKDKVAAIVKEGVTYLQAVHKQELEEGRNVSVTVGGGP